ncbi:MAG: serine hydrolase domain-containing protein [Acetobacteraceae bacterium]
MLMRRRFMTSTAAGFAVAASAKADTGTSGASLDAILTPYLQRYTLPALAAAVVKDGHIIASGAVGTRRFGETIPVTIDDRFHIGSDTKAMTALLAGMLVEAGKLRWDITVAEAFPEFAAQMDPRLRGVTLMQLLSHTSGMPSDNEAFMRLIQQSFTLADLNLDALRAWLVGEWSKQPLEAEPGSRFAYSNMGYVMAGSIIERAGGKTWEELVSERVFDPLRLRTAGLGPQSSLGRVDAPLGHAIREDGTLKPMLAGPYGDNPAVLGPAGTVHLSVLDFAAWAGWNAGEGKRGPALVRPETIRKLHAKVISMERPDAPPGTPKSGGYGLGWGMLTPSYASGPVLQHAGSNGMNLASILVQPDHDFALVMTTNVGGKKADAAFLELTDALYKAYA